MIKVVLFDYDGTLVDSFGAVEKATNLALVKNGFAAATQEEFLEGMKHRTTLRFQYHTKATDLAFLEKISRQFYDELSLNIQQVKLLPGIKKLLQELSAAKIRMGIISNNRTGVIEKVLKHHNIDRHFSIILGEDNVEEPKPHPRGIEKALEFFHIETHEAFYVGDSVTDVKLLLQQEWTRSVSCGVMNLRVP